MEKRIKISGPGLFWPGQTPKFKNAGSGVPWRKFWIGYHARSTPAILSSFWSFPVVGKLPPNPRPQNFYSLFHSPVADPCRLRPIKASFGHGWCHLTHHGSGERFTFGTARFRRHDLPESGIRIRFPFPEPRVSQPLYQEIKRKEIPVIFWYRIKTVKRVVD